jgi:hypothetical protein
MVRGWLNDELEIIWKEVAVAQFETMSREFAWRAEEKYENFRKVELREEI